MVLAILFAYGTLAAACDHAPMSATGTNGPAGPGGPAQAAALFPAMPVGTAWNYILIDSVEGGPPPASPDTFVISQMVVADSIDSAGVHWAGLNGEAYLPLGDDLSNGPSYYANREGGLWLSPSPVAGVQLPPLLMFKYPAKQGDTFFPTASEAFLQKDMVTVPSIDTVITVPAGSFHCVRYNINSLDVMFVAPGVGVVKAVSGLWLEETASGQVLSSHRNVVELKSLITPSG